MDWAFVAAAAIGVVGAALAVGGVVAYRGSRSNFARALAASAVVAGVVIWAIILYVTPVSTGVRTG